MSKTAATLVLLSVVALVGCDHATKHAARQHLRGEPPVQLVSGVLDLTYTENRDSAFSTLRSIPEGVRYPLLVGLNLATLVAFLALWVRRRRAPWYEQVAYALVIAGALGNTTDRIFRGFVIDFIHLHYWPIFNAADAYLVAGIAVLVLFGLRRPRPSPEAAG